MVLRRSRKEAVLAGPAAKAQAPVVVADKAKPAPTVGTAVFQLGHGALPPIGAQSRHAPQARSIGMATNLPSELDRTQERALAKQSGIAFRLVDRGR